MIKLNNKGESLIETIVSLTLLVVVITTVTQLSSGALRITNTAIEKNDKFTSEISAIGKNIAITPPPTSKSFKMSLDVTVNGVPYNSTINTTVLNTANNIYYIERPETTTTPPEDTP